MDIQWRIKRLLVYIGLIVAILPLGMKKVYAATTPVVESYTANSAAAASVTLTKPASVAVGDLLLILVGNDNATATAQWDNTTYKPSGLTLINESGNATSDTHTAAFYRVADGTEGLTIAVSAQSSNDYWGYYVRVSGIDPADPINVTGADVNTADTAPSIAITGVNTDVMRHGNIFQNNTKQGFFWAD